MHDQKKGTVLQNAAPELAHSLEKKTRTIDIGIKEDNRQQVVALLQPIIANLGVLYAKTRNYHWNLTGPRFHTLHLFLEQQYKQLAEAADEVAERTRSLGGFAIGTLAEFKERVSSKKNPVCVPCRRDARKLAR